MAARMLQKEEGKERERSNQVEIMEKETVVDPPDAEAQGRSIPLRSTRERMFVCVRREATQESEK
jgi:hypothetical protein